MKIYFTDFYNYSLTLFLGSSLKQNFKNQTYLQYPQKSNKLSTQSLHYTKQELRAHMALVTRSEEPRAKSSYDMSTDKILRINSLH